MSVSLKCDCILAKKSTWIHLNNFENKMKRLWSSCVATTLTTNDRSESKTNSQWLYINRSYWIWQHTSQEAFFFLKIVLSLIWRFSTSWMLMFSPNDYYTSDLAIPFTLTSRKLQKIDTWLKWNTGNGGTLMNITLMP